MKSPKKQPKPAPAPQETPAVVDAPVAEAPAPRGFDGRHMVIGKGEYIREGRVDTHQLFVR